MTGGGELNSNNRPSPSEASGVANPKLDRIVDILGQALINEVDGRDPHDWSFGSFVEPQLRQQGLWDYYQELASDQILEYFIGIPRGARDLQQFGRVFGLPETQAAVLALFFNFEEPLLTFTEQPGSDYLRFVRLERFYRANQNRIGYYLDNIKKLSVPEMSADLTATGNGITEFGVRAELLQFNISIVEAWQEPIPESIGYRAISELAERGIRGPPNLLNDGGYGEVAVLLFTRFDLQVSDIAALIGVGKNALEDYFHYRGLLNKGSAWSPEELETLRAYYGLIRLEELAAILGRTDSAVRKQAVRQGLTNPNNVGKVEVTIDGYGLLKSEGRLLIDSEQLIKLFTDRIRGTVGDRDVYLRMQQDLASLFDVKVPTIRQAFQRLGFAEVNRRRRQVQKNIILPRVKTEDVDVRQKSIEVTIELIKRNGRFPKQDEIANEVGMSKESLKRRIDKLDFFFWDAVFQELDPSAQHTKVLPIHIKYQKLFTVTEEAVRDNLFERFLPRTRSLVIAELIKLIEVGQALKSFSNSDPEFKGFCQRINISSQLLTGGAGQSLHRLVFSSPIEMALILNLQINNRLKDTSIKLSDEARKRLVDFSLFDLNIRPSASGDNDSVRLFIKFLDQERPRTQQKEINYIINRIKNGDGGNIAKISSFDSRRLMASGIYSQGKSGWETRIFDSNKDFYSKFEEVWIEEFEKNSQSAVEDGRITEAEQSVLLNLMEYPPKMAVTKQRLEVVMNTVLDVGFRKQDRKVPDSAGKAQPVCTRLRNLIRGLLPR